MGLVVHRLKHLLNLVAHHSKLARKSLVREHLRVIMMR